MLKRGHLCQLMHKLTSEIMRSKVQNKALQVGGTQDELEQKTKIVQVQVLRQRQFLQVGPQHLELGLPVQKLRQTPHVHDKWVGEPVSVNEME